MVKSPPQPDAEILQLQARVAQLEQENLDLKQTLERSIDLEARTERLENRDCILEATAAVANALLTTPNFDQAVNTALRIIGECLDTDRVCIIENFKKPSEPFPGWQLLYEWNSPYTIPQISHPDVAQGSYEEIADWYALCRQGQCVSSLLEDMPEPFRRGQAQIGVKALHIVPIFVEGKFWGVVGFDDCRESKHRSLAELTLLKIAAACIGSAIQHDRIQQYLIAERARASEERAAELAKANEVLQRTTSQLVGQQNLKHLLKSVLLEVAHEIGAINSCIFLYEEQTHTLLMHNAVQDGQVVNLETDPRFELWRTPVPADINGAWKRMQNQGYVWHELEQNDVVGDEIWDISLPWHQMMGHRFVVAVLLQAGDAPLGFMGLCFRESVHLSAERIELVQALTNQAALAIQLMQLAEEAKQAAVLDERNRMARDIHDTLAQAFTGVIVQLEATKRKLGSAQFEAAQEHVARARNLATAGLSEARRSVRALRPEVLESDDLLNALRQLAEQMSCQMPIQVTVQIEGDPYVLPAEVETHLLRIAQEALTNALRHAQAQTIRLELLFETAVVHLHVIDDGQGFDPKSHINMGFGLISMQERSQRIDGQFTITSKVGEGTEITVSVPV